MGVMASVGRPARLALAASLACASLVPAASPALGADPVLSAPSAVARFLTDITFTGTATLSGGVKRIEIVLEVEGSTRSFVADVAASGSGGKVPLEYVLDTPGGALLPNTGVGARFRATMDDGSTVDGPSTTVRYEDTRFAWRAVDGEFVTVHWTEGGAAFGERAVKIADDAVRDVGTLLGVADRDRIDFFIYADRDAFYDVLGAASRENVGGQAHPEIRTLFANIGPASIDSPWVGTVIPHELTHLVFDTAVDNPYHYPPRWLNEGVAVYLSEGYGVEDRAAVADAVRAGSLMPLRALGGQFPTTGDRFRLAYAESVAAVDFLVRSFGQEAMVALVRSYAAGVTDDEAFQASIGLDVPGFEAAWLASLGAPLPSPYGPVAAPGGPVPSDWIGEPPVPGEIPGTSVTPGASTTPGPLGPTEEPTTEAIGPLPIFLAFGAAAVTIGLWIARRRRST